MLYVLVLVEVVAEVLLIIIVLLNTPEVREEGEVLIVLK